MGEAGIRRITKLLDAVESKTDLWLVMEYGGDVLSKVAFRTFVHSVHAEELPPLLKGDQSIANPPTL
eukprot:3678078-Amphidinium_carterae.1